MTNKTYDILKYIAQVVLPAVSALYVALSGVWGLPYGEQVAGTLAAIDAFMGALLHLQSKRYYDDGDPMTFGGIDEEGDEIDE